MLALSAFGIYFHALFLSITLGFPPVIIGLLWKYMKSNDEDYFRAARLMTSVLAVNFALGAITGTLVEFGLVQAWPGTILVIASFALTPLAFELIMFANEIATLVLFIVTLGKIRTSRSIAILAVYWAFAAGSGILITSVNSWLVVPWGTGSVPATLYPFLPEYGPLVVDVKKLVALKVLTLASGLPIQAIIQNPNVAREVGVILTDPFVAFYNPFALYSVLHALFAAFLVGSSIALASYGYRYHKTGDKKYLKVVKVAAFVVLVFFLVQPTIFGHFMGEGVVEYNPTKFALIEGAEETFYNPVVALIAYGNPSKPIPGFDEFRRSCDELGSSKLGDLVKSVGLSRDYLLALSSELGVQISEKNIDSALNTGLKRICYTDLDRSLSRMQVVHTAYYTKIAFGILGFISAVALFAHLYRINPISMLVLKILGERSVVVLSFLILLGSVIPSTLGWFVREVGRKPWTVYGLLYPDDLVTVVGSAVTPEFAAFMGLVIAAIGVSGLFAMYTVATRGYRFVELLKKGSGGGRE
ncbi:cytochrome ubiquinol oxidase subunit I [Archaeoglobus neptunius]|uniref:cytochrome ubiquinol oxidase subunit I n=1 Tax=Archaeoglobus neptunius TaxID=2798580 RepID=UPI00192704BF|nr:cytochrome ubiquinol oxidase subunit I [Archaeoglobus neptunius]